ncbi:MAG: bi-functional transferase/deacetylase [Candidatus Gottesmanbacteria bacterium GW2011_GWA2_43_14]|uniref:Bi-functional transferase/deacetylase n=1 Tax=Candidatus Gottesmanbacteria bacterium GW2011_GWA2_43_14 TaxID=1618443 RepID=A0A0G1FL18_9BACT|nr:MAG: bi-functional transferase/deacetylase [Candidatus Gottesmanbacteria bacterium GW2011_GWA2_43_14]
MGEFIQPLQELPRKDLLIQYCAENNIEPTPGVELCREGSLVTVVIPAYNEKESIGQTIMSLGKSDAPIEIVVVDNGSDDGTQAEVMRLGQEITQPLTLLEATVKGPVYARKRGMDEVVAQYLLRDKSGKPRYIALTDADTLVRPNWARAVYNEFQRSGASALGGTFHFSPELDDIIEQATGIKKYFMSSVDLINYFMINKAALTQTRGANMAIEIAPYAAIGGAQQPRDGQGNLLKGSDVLFGNALRLRGQKVGHIPVMTQSSARRTLTSLGMGESQASISTMTSWIDCRVRDADYLREIIADLNPEILHRHKFERETTFVYHSVLLPVLSGELSLDGLTGILGADHPLVTVLGQDIGIMSGKPVEDLKERARQLDRQFSHNLIEIAENKIHNKHD